MLKKRFKLIFFHEGTSKKVEFNFSKKQILIAATSVLAVYLLFSIASGTLIQSVFGAKTVAALKNTNSRLEKQLNIANGKVKQLAQRMDNLSQSDGELRAYAHLPVLDPEALKMGIGGLLPYQGADNMEAGYLLSKLDELERQVGVQEKSLVDVRDQVDRETELLKSIPCIKPTQGGAFSSLFGHRRDPFNGRWVPHLGVDINAPTGTPVYSTAEGTVIFAAQEPAYGKMIVIDHGKGYKTLYAHLNRFYVSKGQEIKRGDRIADMGSTGRSTGPHVHYEVMRYSEHLNPLDFMFDGYAMARIP
ncbi:MAG: M23 family metallopeptidase [bacterium]|nr:M23 family metallopeptidase [bacterium]